jgi:hypothetical protein
MDVNWGDKSSVLLRPNGRFIELIAYEKDAAAAVLLGKKAVVHVLTPARRSSSVPLSSGWRTVSEQLCAYVTWAGNHFEPAEYCIDLAQEDSEFCPLHDPDNWQPDWDDRRKDLMYDCE